MTAADPALPRVGHTAASSSRRDWPATAGRPSGPAARPGVIGESLTRWVRARVAAQLAEQAHAEKDAGRPPLDAQARRELGWTLITEALDGHVREALEAGRPALTEQEESRVARAVFDALFGMGGFTPLLADPEIENIDANGADMVWVRYADGRRERVAAVAGSDAELVEMIRTVAVRAGAEERRFDRGAPRLTIDLPEGRRLFAVMSVTRRPAVSIRRHRFPTVTLDQLARMGAVDVGLREFLRASVRARKNVLVAGGTNVGKTTFLRALASAIPPHERLVTIEDTYELGLDADADAHPNTVAMQAREPNIEGQGEITQADLVRWALRMSPDRVIVGEVRGAEVIPMCNAMSQGNDGSMATVHSSTSRGVFTKLAAYAVQAPERLSLDATNQLVASAVHFVVHLAWDACGTRVVSSIREVVDADGAQVVSNEVYRPGPDRRAVPGAPLRAETREELVAVGYEPGLLDRPEGWWTR
jgi:Flp pilus assembly CpaF family ATPase